MEYFEQNLERFKTPGIALASGIGAALVIATMPHVFLESAVGATGLSEIFSAAAPPLGNTARGLIALVAGLVIAASVYLFLNRNAAHSADDIPTQDMTNREGQDMSLALRKSINDRELAEHEAEAARIAAEETAQPKSKFSLPKFSLKKLLQKPPQKKAKPSAASDNAGDKRVMDLADLPKLRESDAHPDAPARRPIFAESDLGAPLPAVPVDAVEPQQFAPEYIAPTDEATFEATHEAPEGTSFAEEHVESEEASTGPSREIPEPVKAEMPMDMNEDTPVYPDDLSDMSIGELADRLESGLSRLKKLEAAMMPAEAVAAMDHATANRTHTQETSRGGISVTSAPVEPAPVQNNAPPLKPVEAPAPTEAEVDAARQADMDAALKAALGTLEKMTAQR